MTNPFITLRIPTKEQYAFVELKFENASAEEVKETYDTWTRAFTGDTVGITSKEFNTFLDVYLSTGHAPDGGLQVWEEMNTQQKHVVNECKKAFARIKPKQ